MLLLDGFMGSGKSTVGPLVAARAGLPFEDLDDAIERAAGRPVAEIFASGGEPAFRALERDALRRALAAPAPRVVALGGGALLDPGVRREALASACVVGLRATPATIAARLSGAVRPLLDGPGATSPAAPAERAARIEALLAERAAAYAEAHAHVATDGLSPERIADQVLRAYRDRPVLVPLGARSYGVRVADDAPASIADAARALAPSGLFVITDDHVRPLWGAPLEAALAAAGLPAGAVVALRPGEEHKRLAAIEAALAALIDAGADRDGLVIGHGGGVVCDVAGFVAATLFRGVRWIAAPTTLLAMVDAAVGGKTGVDLGATKNAVGAFHQPSAVVAGPGQLATETGRAYASGLAEVVKAACVGDPALFALLERAPERVLAREPEVLREIVRRSVAVKVAIVARDERESGDRVLLNFGHTLGHALEAEGGFRRLLHGEAVALGMIAMLRAGVALGLTPPELAERVTALLARLGLPVRLEAEPVGAALGYLALDKKRRGATIRAVLLRDLGSAVVAPLDRERLAALLADVARGARRAAD